MVLVVLRHLVTLMVQDYQGSLLIPQVLADQQVQ
jgi:hypothetical protein